MEVGIIPTWMFSVMLRTSVSIKRNQDEYHVLGFFFCLFLFHFHLMDNSLRQINEKGGEIR